MAHKPILIFGYGNPSRGDDALGPALVSRIEQRIQDGHRLSDKIELLTDFQLQVEHAMDLSGREFVIFVDAAVDLPDAYTYNSLQADRDISYTTHAMSPAAVMYVHKSITGTKPPPCHLLSIRGHDFDLGKSMSSEARNNLDMACNFLLEQLAGQPG